MTNEKFWSEVSFATDNPRLYEEISNFRRWIADPAMPPNYLEDGLRHYFGMSDEQTDAWMRWYFSRNFSRDNAKSDMLKAHAIDMTLNHGPWPGRFEMYRYAMVEE